MLILHLQYETVVNPRGWMAIRNIGATDTH
jgi:hypothetical protein